MKITGEELLQAIELADSEKHPSRQIYLTVDDKAGVDEVLIDGYLNLERVAEILSEKMGERSDAKTQR